MIPPSRADALLRHFLPAGDLGLSIIGDLHQEFEEKLKADSLRFPRFWYWRSALGLSVRYAMQNLKDRFSSDGSPSGRIPLMTTALFADLRFGMRMLLKTPLLSLTAILTMGLGVALTTQTFSAVYGSIMRGLPVPGEDRLMAIDQNRWELDIESMEMYVHDFLALREEQTSFEDVAAFYQETVNLAGDEGLPERYSGAYMSANSLAHLGVPPLMGRVFLPGEDTPGSSQVVVLGYDVWKNRFASDPEIVGTIIRVNGEPTTVVGVMPEGFMFPFREDLWLPYRMDATLPRGSGDDLDVFGRLREGVSLEVAREELDRIASGLADRFPDTNRGVGMGLMHYEVRFMPQRIRSVLWVMLAATFGVLLIACANVANLLLARATTRTKEVAIRTAMGASRFRVVRQLMVESAILAGLGGALGFGLSLWGMRIYLDFSAGINRPYWIDPELDGTVLLFSLGVTLVASVAAGFFPAIRASGLSIGEVLKDQSRGSSSLRMGRFSTGLVVTEIAVSCALLVGAGFMVQSVVNVGNLDLGFDPTGVLAGRIQLFEADYPSAESRDQFFGVLKERLEAEPGVSSVGLSTHLPGLGAFIYYVGIEGEAYPSDSDYPATNATVISSDLFQTYGVEFLQGRDFHELETTTGGDPVIIVNQSFARRYLPDGDALGRRIRWGLGNSPLPWMTVVGVVPDMHVGGGVGGLGDDERSQDRIFIPKGLFDHRNYSVSIRSEGDPTALAGRLREIVAEVDPNLPIYDLARMEVTLEQSTWAFKLFGVQFSVFGLLALFLAAVGLYGVMAFSVNQRRQEMGIRLALGAENGSIRRLILRRGAVQLGAGIGVGLILGAAMGPPMRFVLFGVGAGDLRIYLWITGTLLLAGFLACILPAHAATRTEPLEALRGD